MLFSKCGVLIALNANTARSVLCICHIPTEQPDKICVLFESMNWLCQQSFIFLGRIVVLIKYIFGWLYDATT